MKLAYLILIHHLPNQFKRMLRAIYHPDNIYLVHADLKSPPEIHKAVEEIIASYRSNVSKFSPQRCVYLGWTVVETRLKAISHHLALDGEWQFVITAQLDNDFPSPGLGWRMAVRYQSERCRFSAAFARLYSE